MGRGPAPPFRGRASEKQTLARLVETVRRGESAALVVRGEAGVGKTALVLDCMTHAHGCRVARFAGIESEMELRFAALHQICGPMLGDLGRLPEPQQDALRVVFGLTTGPRSDRFLVGLAVLGLVAEFAAEQPLLCFVDDAQWLDEASAQVLAFVARRLRAESVCLVFAVREPTDHRFAGLPELRLGGLSDDDGRALLASVVPGRLDDRVLDRLVAETRGNPLALLELPRGMTAAELAGGFAQPVARDVPAQIENHYLRRLDVLPEATQRLMLLATADPTGDTALVLRAAETMGITPEAATPAEADELIDVGLSIRFRHPLVRSATYQAATLQERRAAHVALAAATDPEVDPDRRAWHRAAAALGPDETIAVELERSAGRARARAGVAASAAFLQRAVMLTDDPGRRASRALVAARANLHAGAFDVARELLAIADADAQDELERALVDRLRGQVASASGGTDASEQLLKAAIRLETFDATLARETYLDACGAALFAGHLASVGTLRDVAGAVMSPPRSPPVPSPSDLLLDGFALLVTRGRAEAAPLLRRAVDAFRGEAVSVDKGLQWSALASSAAAILWDFESWDAVITRQMDLARAAGALAPLSIALNGAGLVVAWRGDLEVAERVAAEAEVVVEATETRIAPYGALLLAALRGRAAEATPLIDATIDGAVLGGEGLAVRCAQWTSAVLFNGLARYEDALAAAQEASADTPDLFVGMWALPELIEASVRSGNGELAADALARLAESATTTDADWGLGVLARSRALAGEGDAAESCYREAVERLGRTPLRPELARAHLVYGEWLRRESRRLDARRELRAAYEMFVDMGIDGFAQRTRRELLATGVKVRQRRDDTRSQLTPQEELIARLARDGRTNPEIGAELYLSARTVEWHLRKVFSKLGINSRKDLHGAFPARRGYATSA